MNTITETYPPNLGRRDATTLLDQWLEGVVTHPLTHGKWLNTISYMEHIGATLIAETQKGVYITQMVLKHAAEEARHGYYLKKLSDRVAKDAYPTYESQYLYAPHQSRRYLYRLNVAASRLAKEEGFSDKKLHELVYLLVTYAIEVRADALYPVYQKHLSRLPYKISVQTIINEEVGHLEEMRHALQGFEKTETYLAYILKEEEILFAEWVEALMVS